MLIDETSFDTMIADLATTAGHVFGYLFLLALVVGIVFALCRWGIRGVIAAFDMMDSKYDDGS